MTEMQTNHRNTLPGSDDITRVELENGIIVLTRPNFDSPSVVLSGYLASGSLFDPDEKLGLAHFTAAALLRGTARYKFQEIFNALESVGASLGFGAGMHNTGFNSRSLVEDLPLLLELLSEAMRKPVFPTDQVERLRAQLLTGLAIRSQDTGEMASMTFDKLLYTNHPYARPEEGNPETIRAITAQELQDFYRIHFGPRHMVLVVVGAVEADQAIDQVRAALGDWRNPEQPEPVVLPPVELLTEPIRQHVPIPGKSQSDLVMGCLGPSRLAPDFVAASLGNNILGQFGMMGRIGDVVREQAGLAYYAYTSLNAGMGPGSWEVTAGVNPANLDKAVDLVKAEITRFVREPVSAEELSDSQANYIGRLPLSLESNNGMASALLNLERYSLGLDYYRQYADMVRIVTPEAILDVAQRYLNLERLAVSSAGPAGGERTE
jgi:zinc protease